jgi:hypothetical protein
MKLARPAVALATLACLAGGLHAQAATAKPVCNLLTDDAGDATGFLVTGLPLPNNANLDILSGDIASNAKTVTGVLRLANIGKDSTSVADTYYVNFTVGESTYYLAATYDGTTATYAVGDNSGTGGTRHTIAAATGKVDAAKKTVTISTPLSTIGLTSKAVYTDINALAQRYIGGAGRGLTPTADDATTDKTYKGGTLSCVKP